jgi:hypothetical protein
MTPAIVHFKTKNNGLWEEGFKLGFRGGAAFNFADYSPLRMQVKVSPDHPLFELELTEGAGLSVDADGGLSIHLPLPDVFDLLGVYTHDIVGTQDGEPIPIVEGTVTFVQGNTYTWP